MPIEPRIRGNGFEWQHAEPQISPSGSENYSTQLQVAEGDSRFTPEDKPATAFHLLAWIFSVVGPEALGVS